MMVEDATIAVINLGRPVVAAGASIQAILLHTFTAPFCVMHVATSASILRFGLELMGIDHERHKAKSNLRDFRSHYGMNPVIYAHIWYDMQTTNVQEARIDTSQEGVCLKNFLFALYYLRTYPTEDQLAPRWGLSVKTARKWGWFFLEKIAALRASKVSTIR